MLAKSGLHAKLHSRYMSQVMTGNVQQALATSTWFESVMLIREGEHTNMEDKLEASYIEEDEDEGK